MIRTIIIDDEPDARENLGNLLQKYCPALEIVAEADSAVAGFEAIQQHNPELLFLDIQMADGTGFDLLEKLKNFNFEVIFVTAYDEYALKAIKFAALDYLLKPINILDLKTAVVRAEERLKSKIANDQLKVFSENQKSNIKKIGIPTSEGVIYVPVNQIVRCESSDNYTTFFLREGRNVMVSKSLKEYENMLQDYNFFRIHQSHLINLEYVKKYVKGSGGHVVMQDDAQVPVARRKKDTFLQMLEIFMS